jgi:hypothetical protein
MSRIIVLAAVIGFCSMSLTGLEAQQRSEQLPGSAGPRVEFLNKNPVGGVEILDVWVEAVLPTKTNGMVQVLPTGTTRLNFVIRTKQVPPKGTRYTVDFVNHGGPVRPAGTQMSLTTIDRKTDEATFELLPPDHPYPDGPYRGTVTIGEVKVAVLNWSVGTPTPEDGKAKI